MSPTRPHSSTALASIARELGKVGANLTIRIPRSEPIQIGQRPELAVVVLHTDAALTALARQDHLALAEAYLQQEIDIHGNMTEIMKCTDVLEMDATWIDKALLWLRLILSNRLRYNRDSIASHYDRAPEFFLPWFDRWRSYSHGFYYSPDDRLSDAQARKMQYAINALGLKPGMDVFDMGGGWGCFVEFAGLQGISVHTITISGEQFRFMQRLIEANDLPCTVEMVDFFEYQPRMRFDGAVFMGTFEHVPEYTRVAEFLARHLKPGARLYTDFCAQRIDTTFGKFMKKYIWPGPTEYVNLSKLVAALVRAGFNIHDLGDDTLSYAYTVRDWGDALEAQHATLAERWGEETVRAFLLFLRGSYYFLINNKTQAYHLVAGLDPARPQR
jgi:cyclopropane-fatty-acyl-phospholipid synthase